MKIHFDPKDTIGGVLLAFAGVNGFDCPMLIAGIDRTPEEYANNVPPRYTVASMQDGYSFFTGTREEVIEWMGSKNNLQVIPKMLFKGLIGQLPENRAQMPIVAIAYSGAAGAKH